jgi:hypothetical protein
MPKYRFTVTRNVTESAQVVAEAENIHKAQELSLAQIRKGELVPQWESDDPPAKSNPYIGDYTEYEVVKENDHVQA